MPTVPECWQSVCCGGGPLPLPPLEQPLGDCCSCDSPGWQAPPHTVQYVQLPGCVVLHRDHEQQLLVTDSIRAERERLPGGTVRRTCRSLSETAEKLSNKSRGITHSRCAALSSDLRDDQQQDTKCDRHAKRLPGRLHLSAAHSCGSEVETELASMNQASFRHADKSKTLYMQ